MICTLTCDGIQRVECTIPPCLALPRLLPSPRDRRAAISRRPAQLFVCFVSRHAAPFVVLARSPSRPVLLSSRRRRHVASPPADPPADTRTDKIRLCSAHSADAADTDVLDVDVPAEQRQAATTGPCERRRQDGDIDQVAAVGASS